MTNQPQWKLLWATDYSRLLVDETGVYDPELEVCQEIHDSSETVVCPDCGGSGFDYETDDDCQNVDCYCGKVDTGNDFEVFRVSCERYKLVTDDENSLVKHMVPFSFDPSTHFHTYASYEPWFFDKLKSVADCNGMDLQALIDCLCSEDPSELAQAYDALGGNYFGYHEFDSYPLTMKEKELNARWEKDK